MKIDASEQLEYYLESLGELGEVLINSKEPESIGKGILRITLGIVMASKGVIFLTEEKEKRLKVLSAQGNSQEKSFLINRSEKKYLKNFEGYGYYNEKESILNEDLKLYFKSLTVKVIVPLYHKQDLIGILCVGQKFMKQEYSMIEIKLLQIISNHLTKALYNYILISEVNKKENILSLKLLELETLFDISLAISSVLDVKELSGEILWRSVGILNASKGIILIPKKDSPILETASTFNWDEKTPLLSKKLKTFKDMDETGQGYIFSTEELSPIQKKIKEQNLLMYPLKVKKTILGYMILCNKESRSGVISFNEDDLNLLSALGNQAAVALDNARLFKDINKTKKFNESILSSIATGVLTLNSFGEIDSVNDAASKIIKIPINELIGNHYMYTFEKDESIIELIQLSESQNKTKAEINLPFKTASEDSIINFSISPRVDEHNNTLGSVISLEDITDISKVKNTFKRYVSKQVVDELLGDDTKLKLGGEEREVTVLFSDIRGFTSMSEKLKAEDVVNTLNNYFSDMIDIVFKYNGTLDKIIGDELMIVYGAPLVGVDDTKRAVKTAIEMQKQIKIINERRTIDGLIPIKVGMGINQGTVVSGNIGSRDMMDYTVIGDTVNLGARLCSYASPDEIIVSNTVYEQTKTMFNYCKLDSIKVKGKRKKVEIYRINYD